MKNRASGARALRNLILMVAIPAVVLTALASRTPARPGPEGEKPRGRPAAESAAAEAPRRDLAVANAVRNNPGFRTNVIPRNDDGSGPLTPIGFTVGFFGQSFTQLFVNNNGNLTFDEDLATFTPFPLTNTRRVIIAPYFADVDTRGQGSELVTFGTDTVDGRRAFGANYINVGYYDFHVDKLNSFQVILIDRSDVGAGDFDIEFNYNTVKWETGDASGGVNGFGGVPARVGYSNGTGNPGTFFELPGSAESGAFLDSNVITGLSNNSLGSEVQGRYVYPVRRGLVQTVDLSALVVDAPRTVRAGDEVTFVVRVRNTGDVAAGGVSLRASIPAGAIFVSARPGQGTCRGVKPLVCSIGTLAPGASADVRVTVVPTGVGELNVSAAAFSFQPDANIDNNRAPEVTTLVTCQGPAIRFISPSVVRAGSGDFTLSVTGICFEPNSQVRWNGRIQPTTFVDSSILQAQIPATDLEREGPVQVIVSAGLRFSGAVQAFVAGRGASIATINNDGIVNAAGFGLRATAANTIVALFGSNLASGTAAATGLPLPASLGGVSVRVNSYTAPLVFVSPQQINFVMPWEVLGLSEVLVTVSNGVTTNAVVVALVNSDPAIFTVNQRGSGQGTILTETGEVAAAAGSVAGRTSRPARRGEVIQIFATGLGPVTVQPPTGSAAPADGSARALLVPTVNIDGADVTPEFAGLAPGFVGLYQINARIPANARTGSAIPVKLVVSDVSSNTVTIAVQ